MSPRVFTGTLVCALVALQCGHVRPNRPEPSKPRPHASAPVPALSSRPGKVEEPFDALVAGSKVARSPVGAVLLGTPELSLASAPGAPPHRRAGGSPAIVVGQAVEGGVTYLRVRAADDSYGWTDRVGSLLESRVVFPGGDATLLARPLAPDDAEADQVEERSVKATSGSVIGASDGTFRELMWQLGQGDYFDDVAVPWLEVKVDAVTGFLQPSRTFLVWPAQAREPRASAIGLRGVVRSSFLLRSRASLLSLGPREGAAINRLDSSNVEEWPRDARCVDVAAALFSAAERPLLLALECEHRGGKIGNRSSFRRGSRPRLARCQDRRIARATRRSRDREPTPNATRCRTRRIPDPGSHSSSRTISRSHLDGRASTQRRHRRLFLTGEGIDSARQTVPGTLSLECLLTQISERRGISLPGAAGDDLDDDGGQVR